MIVTAAAAAALLLSSLGADVVSIAPREDGRSVEASIRLGPAPANELAKAAVNGRIARELGEQWLQFALIDDDGKPGLPIIGRYRLEGRTLRFTPKYRLAFGQRYQALFKKGDPAASPVQYVVPPRKPTPPTVVERIYPTASRLPANHLKFYIHFSQPMREGKQVFEHFLLLDDRGRPVPDPWRRTELWSDDARRLTLWIHPGRVKRGVNLREQIGPVLEAGKSYRLIVSQKLRDQNDQPLAGKHIKRFTAEASDHRRPLPRDWLVQPPTVDTRQPLTLRFGEPLDRHLLQRFVRVVDPQGKFVEGKIRVMDEERTWRFRPDRPWRDATYEVRVSRLLEDLAGNTPERVFDTDLRQPAAEPGTLARPFRPAAD